MASYRKAYAAYKAGQMDGDPEKKKRFEALIKSGVVPVQEYESENDNAPADDRGVVVQLKKPKTYERAFRAYTRGEMSEDQAKRFRAALQSGEISVPRAVVNKINQENVDVRRREIEAAEGPKPETTIGGQIGGIVRGAGPTAMGAAAGLAGGPAAPVTVPAGALAGSLAKPVIDPVVATVNAALKKVGIDADIPDASDGFKYLFDSLGIPVPDTEVERLTQTVAETVSGTGAAVKAGQMLTRAGGVATRRLGALLAEAPASQLATDTAAAAAGQAAAESDLPPWAQMPFSLAAGAVTGAVTAPKRPVVSREVLGADAAATGRRAGGGGAPAATSRELADVSRDAVGAVRPKVRREMETVLAEQAAPDQETMAAAKRLGVDQYLQPDHVTSNQRFREFSQALKSEIGSEERAKEIEGVIKVAERAKNVVEELGGTRDFSTLSDDVRIRLEDAQKALDTEADEMYDALRARVPEGQEIEAPGVLAFIEEQAGKRRGKRLTATEKKIKTRLSEGPDGSKPTYTDLDEIRQDIGQALRRGSGPFKDANTGFLKKVYGLLSEDQRLVAERNGAVGLFDKARATVAQRKAIEDDLSSLFGRQIDKSISSRLTGAMKAAAKGDEKQLVRLLKHVPKEMRPQVVASGLSVALKKQLDGGEVSFKNFYKWHKSLREQKAAYTAVMEHLPDNARQRLADLAKVSEGISRALDQRVETGKLADFRLAINGADSVARNLYDIAKNTAVRSGLEVATSAAGMPGVGLSAAFASALGQQAAKRKRDLFSEVQDLLMSDEFRRLVVNMGGPAEAAASKAFLRKKKFKNFWSRVANPRDITPAQWLRTAIEAAREREGGEESREQ